MNENLSSEELIILSDADFLKSKKAITGKIEDQLKEIYTTLKGSIKNWKIDPHVLNTNGKISKGENYQDLPYFVLDYPRIFGEDTFSIRTIILWGRYIGLYFIVSGKYLDYVNIEKLLNAEKSVLISVKDSPWEHLITDENYKPLTDFNQEIVDTLIKKNGFLKIALKLNLNEIPDLKDRVLSFSKLLTLFTKLK